MLEPNKTSYFLVEQDDKGVKYPMQKSFNGNGFQRAYDDNAIYKFNDLEKVKQACTVQNMMNSVFGSDKIIYYCKEDIKHEIFNDKGEVIDIEQDSSQSEPQA